MQTINDIVKTCGGRWKVENKEEKGSEFTISFDML